MELEDRSEEEEGSELRLQATSVPSGLLTCGTGTLSGGSGKTVELCRPDCFVCPGWLHSRSECLSLSPWRLEDTVCPKQEGFL